MFAPALQFGSSVCLMSFLKPDLYGLSKPINLEWFNCQKRQRSPRAHSSITESKWINGSSKAFNSQCKVLHKICPGRLCQNTKTNFKTPLFWPDFIRNDVTCVFLFEVGLGDISHAICMCISVKPVPWLAVNLHHLFSNRAAVKTQSRSSRTSYAISRS